MDIEELISVCREIAEELGDPAPWKDVTPTTHRKLLAILNQIEIEEQPVDTYRCPYCGKDECSH